MSNEFKLVPVEPTDEMKIAGGMACQYVPDWEASLIYEAMLAAAPQPPALGDDLEDALRDLSSSACQMALTNGINEDAFLRLARSVRQLIEANKQPADQQGEPVMKLEAEKLWGGHGEYAVSFVKAGWLKECREKGGTFPLYTHAQPATAKADEHPDIDAAARKLAECMDYPWEYMPEQGRASMREHAKAVIEAGRAKPNTPQ
ncbi:hypothetical protein [Pseudomonas fragariae (ex Marin et al. 2024)]|uniref:hypothetical protein n=1 Tax=Pseudomonas fragariae (ex Marin et al. 2024) TaxID=3080056 RepID=UPI003F7A26F9